MWSSLMIINYRIIKTARSFAKLKWFISDCYDVILTLYCQYKDIETIPNTLETFIKIVSMVQVLLIMLCLKGKGVGNHMSVASHIESRVNVPKQI